VPAASRTVPSCMAPPVHVARLHGVFPLPLTARPRSQIFCQRLLHLRLVKKRARTILFNCRFHAIFFAVRCCGKITQRSPPRSGCPAARDASLFLAAESLGRAQLGRRAADFSNLHQRNDATGCPASALLIKNDVWPRMLVSAFVEIQRNRPRQLQAAPTKLCFDTRSPALAGMVSVAVAQALPQFSASNTGSIFTSGF